MIDQTKLKKLLAELQRLKAIKDGGISAGLLFDLTTKLEGLKGDKGDTPQKGIDYYTQEEIEHIVDVITKAVQREIRIPKDGKDGKDGKTPVAGVDYPTIKYIEGLIRDLIKKIPSPVSVTGATGLQGEKGESGSPDTPEEIRDKLEILKGDERLDKNAIRGITVASSAPANPQQFDIWVKI